MAAPANKTTKDLSGSWKLNTTLSGSADPAFALQGISYLVRTGISYATITIAVNQYEAPPKPPNTSTDSFTHIDIEQSASGLNSTKEMRCLDNTWRPHSDWLFGSVKGRSEWVSLADIEEEHLKSGLESSGAEGDKEYILSHVESQDSDWTATQIWGFKIIDGERRYCRNIVVKKGDEKVEFTHVYDFLG